MEFFSLGVFTCVGLWHSEESWWSLKCIWLLYCLLLRVSSTLCMLSSHLLTMTVTWWRCSVAKVGTPAAFGLSLSWTGGATTAFACLWLCCESKKNLEEKFSETNLLPSYIWICPVVVPALASVLPNATGPNVWKLLWFCARSAALVPSSAGPFAFLLPKGHLWAGFCSRCGSCDNEPLKLSSNLYRAARIWEFWASCVKLQCKFCHSWSCRTWWELLRFCSAILHVYVTYVFSYWQTGLFLTVLQESFSSSFKTKTWRVSWTRVSPRLSLTRTCRLLPVRWLCTPTWVPGLRETSCLFGKPNR